MLQAVFCVLAVKSFRQVFHAFGETGAVVRYGDAAFGMCYAECDCYLVSGIAQRVRQQIFDNFQNEFFIAAEHPLYQYSMQEDLSA